MNWPSGHLRSFDGTAALITGGAGFIGSHLAARLVQLGAEVRIIDDLSGDARGGRRGNVPDGADLRIASILDDGALRDAMRGCRFVFHQAAMVSVPLSIEQPRRCLEINCLGTQRVLDAAREAPGAAPGEAGAARVVFAGSAAVYGPAPGLPCSESQPPDCASPYAASKLAGEALCRAAAINHGLSTVCLRYFNIFGPRQSPDSPYAAVITAFLKAIGADRSPVIFGDGTQTRDFTHVDNVVDANLLAAVTPRALAGEAINIGTGRRLSLLEVLAAMERILGREIQPGFAPPRPGDVPHSQAEISRARQMLGYEPRVSFEDGLAQLLDGIGSASREGISEQR